MSRTELRIYDALGLRFIPLGHVEHRRICPNFIIKTFVPY